MSSRFHPHQAADKQGNLWPLIIHLVPGTSEENFSLYKIHEQFVSPDFQAGRFALLLAGTAHFVLS